MLSTRLAYFLGLVTLTIIAVSVGAVLIDTYRIRSQAAMATVGIDVYWDITCIRPCTSLNWGVVMPGESKTISLFVKNSGELPIFGSINTTEWVPEYVADYISLSWNFGSAALLPGRVRPTNFTLFVSPEIHDVTTFYFTIIVIGASSD